MKSIDLVISAAANMYTLFIDHEILLCLSVLLQECTLSEIESRLYDKFNITITEVKALLADSGSYHHMFYFHEIMIWICEMI